MLLAGDIGGTNARLAIFEPVSRALVSTETFRTEAWTSAEDVVAEFLARHPAPIGAACLAVAGPVRNGRSERVNIPWSVDEASLSRMLGLHAVAVVNDLEANARGIPLLDAAELALVSDGDPGASGNRAVVSAGTGLGEAALVWDGDRYHAVAGEGGHADFAPRSELEVGLFRYLAADYGHVSYERVCSGNGLVNIYRFLRDAKKRPATQWFEEQPVSPSAAAITAEAAADPRSLSAQALQLFASIYGSRAANVALAFMATGGVYLGGGIAPRIVKHLQEGAFMEAFTAKGRMSRLLRDIPVRVVLNDRAALLGAAEIAAERLAAFSHHENVVAIRASTG
jgi:glucokinase